MADKTARKYSQIATAQVNKNATTRHSWTDMASAVGDIDKTYAYSHYSEKKVPTHYVEKTTYDKKGKAIKTKVADKWKTTTNHPWTVAFHNFDLNIPSGSHIKKINFTVRIKCDKNLTVLAPACNFRVNSPSKTTADDKTNGKKTGWDKGCYIVVPKTTKLTNSWQEVTYTMTEDAIKKGGISMDYLNYNIMGCDLEWQDFEKITGSYDKNNQRTGKVYISWVRCKVTYDVPDYQIDIVHPTEEATAVGKVDMTNVYNRVSGRESSPFVVEPDTWFNLKVKCTNSSYAHGKNYKYILIDVPWASEIDIRSGDGDWSYDVDARRWIWKVPVKAYADYTLNIRVKSSSSSVSRIYATLKNSPTGDIIRSTDYYFVANQFELDLSDEDVGYFEFEVKPDVIKAYQLSCVDVIAHGVVSDNTVDVTVDPDIFVDMPLNYDGHFSLTSFVSEGTVELLSQDGDTATLSVPFETEFIAVLRYCFYPRNKGTVSFVVRSSTGHSVRSLYYTIEQSDVFEFSNSSDKYPFNADVVSVQNHRMYSEVESDVIMIPIVSDDIDSSMIMTPCQINMNVWEDLDYIGCVPLEHLHFDPKSTYKDTLLNSTYKNKRYMGKKLATDEDITLNVRLHPQQVTTIQGLIEMDKPIPINANHRCFEGDALNHRGWAEIYSIKAEETNPHWYKCDIDVKYLTHNLKTRFNIYYNGQIQDYPIPSVLSEVFSSGDNLSDTSDDKFFNVETDGTFMYNEDYDDVVIDDDERNFFSLDNGEYIHIQTEKPLSHDTQITYTWSATLLPEDRENKVSKIIKLVDSKGNSVFEYEYNTLEFVTTKDYTTNLNIIEEIRGTIIYRLGDETNELPFTYRFEDGIELDENEVENVVSNELAKYGSTLHFNVQNNILEVIDEGFNGSEVYVNNLKLADTEYYYVVEWRNNNSDGDTDAVDCTVDFQVQDTVLATTYASKFGKLLISPFPVTDKKLLFTRQAEEGTIYYYEWEDGKEFSYIVEPYYQYMNGTDLIGDDTSIFNLNYGYDIVYIQNGLVRLGFNRIDDNGHMYLGKYDPQSEDYITTHILHLGKYTDLNLNAISDDKIEVQASDSTFTIYRGHPYIKINHMDEDIFIDTTFNQVWAEQVGADSSVDLPTYWDLLNTENLLPESIGGMNTLNTSDITVTEVIVDDNDSIEMNWYNPPSDILNDEDTTFTIESDSLQNYSDEVYLDGSECSFGSYTFEKVSDNTPAYIDLISTKDIIQTNESTRLNATVKDWSNTGVSGHTVYFYEVYTPSIDLNGDKSIMQSSDTLTLTAKVKDEDGSLVEGETVYFYEVIE